MKRAPGTLHFFIGVFTVLAYQHETPWWNPYVWGIVALIITIGVIIDFGDTPRQR